MKIRMPSGTLIRNAQCHENSVVSHPPRSGPTAAMPPIVEPQTANAMRALAPAEGGVEERERRRQHQGAADALDEPGQDQQFAGARERRADGGEGEDDDAGEQHPSPSDPVGEAAEDQQERSEHEGVRLLHPLHLGGGDPEVVDDRGDRDVDDRRVDDDQRHGDADEDESCPAAS